MKRSLISIIVPVYNVEKYLKKCLDSLVNQTYSNIEIICVNDGSKDHSLSILKEYEKRDPRIKVIDKENGGLSDARNVGLKHVNGDYLMFVDSDDWIEKTTCEKTVSAIEKYHTDVVMWSYVREFGEKSLPKQIFDHNIYFDKKNTYRKIYRRFFGLYGSELTHPENADAIVTVWGKLYKSDLILTNQIQFVDTKEIATCEDALFNIDVFHYVNSCFFLNYNLYHYRKDPVSFTSSYRNDLRQKWLCLYKRMETIIIKNHLDVTFVDSLNNRIVLNVIGLGFNALSSDKSLREKYCEIKASLKDSKVRKAIKNFDIKFLPIHWKVFFCFVKIRSVVGVYFLTCVMNKLRS